MRSSLGKECSEQQKEKQKKCFVSFSALICDQPNIPLRSISGEGSLHLVGLKNSTVLELVFSASTANLAGPEQPMESFGELGDHLAWRASSLTGTIIRARPSSTLNLYSVR